MILKSKITYAILSSDLPLGEVNRQIGTGPLIDLKTNAAVELIAVSTIVKVFHHLNHCNAHPYFQLVPY